MWRFRTRPSADLRRRIKATNWPEKEPSQTTRRACRSRRSRSSQATGRRTTTGARCEAQLNALPQFITEIDGLDIHFIHVRSQHEDALPLIVNHGWPGSIIEQLKIIDRLTDPTAHGGERIGRVPCGDPVDAGLRVLGQADEHRLGPRAHGPSLGRADEAARLHRYVAQGGDWGAFVVDQMGLQAPEGLLAIHTNMPATVPADVDKASLAGEPPPSGLSAEERRAYEQLIRTYKQVEYARIMASRPQTLYGIADSPVGLAAWLLDHNDADGQPAAAVVSALDRTTSDTGELTRDEILDNITLYWLTNTGVSASRLYWEYKGGFFNAKGVSIPVAVSVFPGEQYQAPRSWAEQAYPNLIYFNEVDKGGHFAAWEQPQLFSRGDPRGIPLTSLTRRRYEQCRDRNRDPALPGRDSRGADRRPAPAHRRDALAHKELVDDRSQGVQLATIRELAHYWATDYDFGRVEARLNAVPQFTTEIDGVDIHFIHVRSEHEDALPLIMTHGWPGSVIELLETVGPLTDPTAHGGNAEDAFHLVLPSLPGYGFSGEPTELGWESAASHGRGRS